MDQIDGKILYSKCIFNFDKKDNETYIYRNPYVFGKDLYELGKGETIQEHYKKFLEEPGKEFLGIRKVKEDGTLENKFSWFTRLEIFNEAEQLASGLKNLNLSNSLTEKNRKYSFMGIFAKN